MDAHRPPRLVAVDMDGTFLRSNHTYDRERFGRLFAAMRAAGCRFVVASGNQYYQLRSFFTDLPFDEVAYVAHNGAYVRVGDEVVSVAKLPESDARHVIEMRSTLKPISTACPPTRRSRSSPPARRAPTCPTR